MKDKLALVVCSALLLSGCGASLIDYNPFAEKETRLPGQRISIIAEGEQLNIDESVKAVPALPPAQSNANWSQPGGEATNSPGHLALSSAVKSAFRVSAVRGSNGEAKLSNPPIIYNGRVYVMDAVSGVSAFSAAGARAWRVSLVPEGEDDDGVVGGGLAADDGRLYAATGFGEVFALNPANGATVWKAKLDTPVRSAPTAAGGRVFVVTADNKVVALNAADGTQAWENRGIQESTGLLSSASPAVSGDIVVVPYSSGEITAFKASTGDPIWSDALVRAAQITSVASIADVAARPIIDRGIVFAVSVSGRMVAVDLKTGERLWEQNISGAQMPVAAGETVYAVTLDGRLVAIARSSGKIRFVAQLPGGRTARWAGPVLAGGNLWLSSSSELLVSVDALNGQITSQNKIGDPSTIAPVVASGRLYLLTDAGALLGFN